MSEEHYRIYPDWKEVLVYDEGPDRMLRFDCDNLQQPYQVYLPSASRWRDETPPWAHERREIILDRIRAANVVICVVDGPLRSIESPDGTLRVDAYYDLDERGSPMRSVRVIWGMETVAELGEALLSGSPQFPAAGEVVLPLKIHKQAVQIGINANDRTFWFHRNERPAPLCELASALQSPRPAPKPLPPAPPRRSIREWFSVVFTLSVAFLFVAAGIFECFMGRTARERWIGALGVIFFGLCGASVCFDARSRRVRARVNQASDR
jgi:hypothetical protein